MIKYKLILLSLLTILSNTTLAYSGKSIGQIELVVLGVAQDAGYPQANCYKPHCMEGWQNKLKTRSATALGIIDHQSHTKYLFEATPQMPEQLYQLHKLAPDNKYQLGGVFLTHAHIGHYTGLMYFGREAIGSHQVPVFVMPKMKQFIEKNGPWSQLVKLNNIQLMPLSAGKTSNLSPYLKVTPLVVPHRDEFSETVGYLIKGHEKTALFIPDIDKWHKWKTDVRTLIEKVDYAFLDATFFDQKELPGRDMNEVPHPFVEESMQLFTQLSAQNKAKIYFIHFNHSNPLLVSDSEAQRKVKTAGFNVAREGIILSL